MNKYRVGLYEEIGGWIVVEAESKEQAKEIGEELLNEHGCEQLFYPQGDLTKYYGNHKHGDRSVEGCEEINE